MYISSSSVPLTSIWKIQNRENKNCSVHLDSTKIIEIRRQDRTNSNGKVNGWPEETDTLWTFLGVGILCTKIVFLLHIYVFIIGVSSIRVLRSQDREIRPNRTFYGLRIHIWPSKTKMGVGWSISWIRGRLSGI